MLSIDLRAPASAPAIFLAETATPGLRRSLTLKVWDALDCGRIVVGAHDSAALGNAIVVLMDVDNDGLVDAVPESTAAPWDKTALGQSSRAWEGVVYYRGPDHRFAWE